MLGASLHKMTLVKSAPVKSFAQKTDFLGQMNYLNTRMETKERLLQFYSMFKTLTESLTDLT